MHKHFDAIFTDFGGVLLNLNFEECFEAFKKLGATFPQEILFRDPEFLQVMQELETGRISDTQFFDTLRNLLHLKADETEIRRAWNTIIGTIPSYKMQVIKEIRQHYPLYMVSNTNAPHFDYVRQILFREEGLTVDDYFDKLYLSHEIHATKPNHEFYCNVLNDCHVNPNSCLFIDDLPANVEGASRAGFEAHLIDPEEDLRKKINELLA